MHLDCPALDLSSHCVCQEHVFSGDEQFILFCQDAGEMDDALYEKLKHVLMEAENLKHEAYEETRRRQMAERELAEASKMVTK